MKLLLIRHGQTPSNVVFALDTGVPGPGLTELGRQQAAALPAALAGVPLDALLASTMVRTQLTAAPLREARGLPVEVHAGLREVAAGDLEMRTDDEAAQRYLDVIFSWVAGDLDRRMPGADDGHATLGRFDAVIAQAAAAGHEAVAVVCHGAVMRLWAAARAGNVPADFARAHGIGNTGVIALEGSPAAGWEVLTWEGRAIAPPVPAAGTEGPAAEPAQQR